jgi:uncharacterized small protein (DUF1192 family)
MFHSAATQTTTSTRHANKVDMTKINRLSERIAALDAEMMSLKSAIRKARLSISRGHTWEDAEGPGLKKKKVKVVLTETRCRDMRVELEKSRYALKRAEYERMSLEHQALSLDAKMETSLYLAALVLSHRAGRNSELFLSMLESRMKSVSPEHKAVLETLTERYKSKPVEARKELMRVVKKSHEGYFIALNEHPSVKTKFFKQFFEGQTPVSQA